MDFAKYASSKGMFPNIGDYSNVSDYGPSMDTMETAEELLKHNKQVKLHKVRCASFKTNNAKSVSKYEALLKKIYEASIVGTTVITVHDRVFIHDGNNSHYHIHMEWYEYKLLDKG